jgi:hypothetical protein
MIQTTIHRLNRRAQSRKALIVVAGAASAAASTAATSAVGEVRDPASPLVGVGSGAV